MRKKVSDKIFKTEKCSICGTIWEHYAPDTKQCLLNEGGCVSCHGIKPDPPIYNKRPNMLECHCGTPIKFGSKDIFSLQYGMCDRCYELRCDVYPGICEEDKNAPRVTYANSPIEDIKIVNLNEALLKKYKEDNTLLTQIKKHFSKNKQLYIGLAIGVVGTLVCVYIIKQNVSIKSNAGIINIIEKNYGSINNTVNNFGGYQVKIVKCITDDKLFESVKEASKYAGVDSTVMSKHLNGHTEHVLHKTYEIIALGTKTS